MQTLTILYMSIMLAIVATLIGACEWVVKKFNQK